MTDVLSIKATKIYILYIIQYFQPLSAVTLLANFITQSASFEQPIKWFSRNTFIWLVYQYK